MITHVITFWHIDIWSLTMSVSAVHFLGEILSILKGKNSNFKGSYDKRSLTPKVISYEIYETHQRLVSYISYEMITHVRSSMYRKVDMFYSICKDRQGKHSAIL